MFDQDRVEVRFGLEAVRRAVELARRVQDEMVGTALAKSDKSPVTVADFAVQALVGGLLAEAFPGDLLVAEEASGTLQAPENADTLAQVTRFVRGLRPGVDAATVCRWIDRGADGDARRPPAAGRFWTLDPIDGTKGFLRGDQYAVALALLDQGEVQVGILGCPNLNADVQPDIAGAGCVVVAVRGQGTWIAPAVNARGYRRLHVSTRSQPHEARVLRSFEAAHTNTDELSNVVQALGVRAAPVLMDSQAKYAVLAAGHGDLLFRLLSAARPDYREQIWDQAAGSLVVQEAGGCITDLAGKALDFTTGRTLANNRGVLASNGKLHAAALAALKSPTADSP